LAAALNLARLSLCDTALSSGKMQTDSAVKFAFLNNEEHPVGRWILKKLCEAGFVPDIVIEERSARAAKKTNAYLRCLQVEEIPPPTQEITDAFGIPSVIVPDINSIESENAIRTRSLTMMVLGNTWILGPHILALAPGRCVNVHPGLLPRIRGSFPQCWSILNDVEIGCTCHLVEQEVDTGPILDRKQLPVFTGDSLERIVARTTFASAELMLNVIQNFENFRSKAVPQARGDGTLYYWPEAEKIEMARRKLASGEYKYLTPRS
jgi:methionyl-tRNA formyltransferase